MRQGMRLIPTNDIKSPYVLWKNGKIVAQVVTRKDRSFFLASINERHSFNASIIDTISTH